MADDNLTPLKRLRTQKRLTQQQLADKIGKPRNVISDWERGQEMNDENRALVARALGVTPSALGPAWNPESPRPSRRHNGRPFVPTQTIPHSETTNPLHSGTSLSSAGVSPMPDMPDAELFDRFSGLWRAMDHDERLSVYRTAARHIGTHDAPRAARTKNT